MLEQLAVFVAIAFRRLEIVRRLEDEHAVPVAFQFQPPGGADRDVDIVARTEIQPAVLRDERSLSGVHENHFVRFAVPVVVFHRLDRARDRHADVLIADQNPPPADRIPGLRHLLGLKEPMT